MRKNRDWGSLTAPLLRGLPKYHEVFLAFGYYKIALAFPGSDVQRIIAYKIIGTNCKAVPDLRIYQQHARSIGDAKVEQIKAGGRAGVFTPAVFLMRARFKLKRDDTWDMPTCEPIGVLDLETGQGQTKQNGYEGRKLIYALRVALSLLIVGAVFYALCLLISYVSIRYPGSGSAWNAPPPFWKSVSDGAEFGCVVWFMASILVIFFIPGWVHRRSEGKMWPYARLVMDQLEIQHPELWQLWQHYHEDWLKRNEEQIVDEDAMGFDLSTVGKGQGGGRL